MANEQLQFTLHGATGLGESKVLQQKKKAIVKKAERGEQNRILKKNSHRVSEFIAFVITYSKSKDHGTAAIRRTTDVNLTGF